MPAPWRSARLAWLLACSFVLLSVSPASSQPPKIEPEPEPEAKAEAKVEVDVAKEPAAVVPPPPVPTAPPFVPPRLSHSLLDFLTGMPIAFKMKEMCTPKLMREPFAGAPLNTPKGLASSIKAQQVDARNRVRAAEFLGTVDCVAYPESQQMLVTMMQEDPQEQVRLAAVEALQVQLGRGQGRLNRREKRRYDACRGCCNAEVLNALAARAYDTDEFGCPVEPSLRVRDAAREAIEICGIDCLPAQYQQYYPGLPPEPVPAGEEEVPLIEGEEVVPTGAQAAASGASVSLVTQHLSRMYSRDRLPMTDPAKPAAPAPAKELAETPAPAVSPAPAASPAPQIAAAPVVQQTAGVELRAPQCPEIESLCGHCIVALHDKQFVKADGRFATMYNGRTYCFSSQEAQQTFERDPGRYAPVRNAIDLVHLKRTGEQQEGRYLSRFESRYYGFLTEENWKEFGRNPDTYINQQ